MGCDNEVVWEGSDSFFGGWLLPIWVRCEVELVHLSTSAPYEFKEGGHWLAISTPACDQSMVNERQPGTVRKGAGLDSGHGGVYSTGPAALTQYSSSIQAV